MKHSLCYFVGNGNSTECKYEHIIWIKQNYLHVFLEKKQKFSYEQAQSFF
ncbi:MAG: hypothetical protein H6Q13_1163 [Bacteroidetes bacterium]|jgi:hypothetical protein|nr:hypothetical protein [Bacteroidota bacterium]